MGGGVVHGDIDGSLVGAAFYVTEGFGGAFLLEADYAACCLPVVVGALVYAYLAFVDAVKHIAAAVDGADYAAHTVDLQYGGPDGSGIGAVFDLAALVERACDSGNMDI